MQLVLKLRLAMVVVIPLVPWSVTTMALFRVPKVPVAVNLQLSAVLATKITPSTPQISSPPPDSHTAL